MLGFDNQLPTRKIAKRFGKDNEEIEYALDALKYLILHIAKTNSTTQADFDAIYDQTGLRSELKQALFQVVKGHITELREILDDENKIGKLRLLNVDWRLSLVTACRQKQKMMVPKYTMQIQVN